MTERSRYNKDRTMMPAGVQQEAMAAQKEEARREILAQIDQTLLEISQLPGIGPKFVRTLSAEVGRRISENRNDVPFINPQLAEKNRVQYIELRTRLVALIEEVVTMK